MKSPTAKRRLATITELSAHVAIPAGDALNGLIPTDRAEREEILHCAYAIWEREGYPENRKLDNWLEAEAVVQGSMAEPPKAG